MRKSIRLKALVAAHDIVVLLPLADADTGFGAVTEKVCTHCIVLPLESRRFACYSGVLPMDIIDLLQWPAMAVTVLAAWLVAAQSKRRRSAGFWVFLAGNVLWIAWGWHDSAHALVALQLCLAALNIRGAFKNDPELATKAVDAVKS